MFACSALVTALYYGPRPDFGDFDTATNPTIPLQHVNQLSCTVETQFWVILSCAGSASLWILVALVLLGVDSARLETRIAQTGIND